MNINTLLINEYFVYSIFIFMSIWLVFFLKYITKPHNSSPKWKSRVSQKPGDDKNTTNTYLPSIPVS